MGKILVIRGGAVGDFILTLPAIQLVRDSLPDNEIEILGYPQIAELAVAGGLADQTRSIETGELATFFAPGAQLNEQWVDYLKSFDVVISYLFDPDGYFTGNLERIGVQTLIAGPFRMDESPEALPAPQQLAQPLEQLALFLEQDYVELVYSKEKQPPAAKPVIAIHPGSGSPAKNWSFSGWVQLASLIRDQYPSARFMISSGEAEYETIAELIQLFDNQAIEYEHLNGLPLVELAQRIASCQFYFGNDSGIGHLAATTGIPGMILFGSSRSHVWAPTHPMMNHLVAPNQQLGSLSAENLMDQTQQFFTF